MKSSSLAAWTGAVALLAVGACTYDFEAPFRETPLGRGGAGGIGGAAGGGGSTTSGTGGQSGGEQCGNGADDDGDDQIDCADPDCSGFTCVPPAPDGWALVALALASEGDSLPDCLPGWPKSGDLQAGLSADPAECECSCSSPTVTCSLAETEYQDSQSCWGGLLDTWTPSANGACDSLSALANSDATDGLDPAPVTVASASCAVVEGSHEVPPATWDYSGRICEGPSVGAGCDGDRVCVPTALAPFTVCIVRGGEHECPAPFDDQTVFYGGMDDQRGCDCACGEPSNATCTAQTELWNGSSSCQASPAAILTHNGTCSGFIGPFIGGSMKYTATPASLPCPASGQPTGQASGTQPRTVCCLP